MGDTFKQIQDDCLDYGYGEADRPRLKGFINDSLMALFARHRWAWSEATTSLSLSAAASSVAMLSMSSAPFLFGRIQKVTSPTGVVVPEYTAYDTEDPLSWVFSPVLAVGCPTQYTLFDDTVYFDRVADRAYTFEYAYWAQPARMTNDNDEPGVPDYCREILRWGALKRHAARERDWTAARSFQQFEDEAFAAAVVADRKDRTSTRAVMPADYYGAYDGKYR